MAAPSQCRPCPLQPPSSLPMTRPSEPVWPRALLPRRPAVSLSLLETTAPPAPLPLLALGEVRLHPAGALAQRPPLAAPASERLPLL